MPRGSFEEECQHPTCFTAWVSLSSYEPPQPFDSIEDAIAYIDLETSWRKQETFHDD